jgi:hypothetical protein
MRSRGRERERERSRQQSALIVKALEKSDTHLGIIGGRGGDENLQAKKCVIGRRMREGKIHGNVSC